MAYQKIIVTHDDGIVRLTLNRPEVLNALDEQMVLEIDDLIDALPGDERARVLLITGAGRAFSSGGDLAGGDITPGEDAGAFLESHFNPLVEKLFALHIPIVSAVNGPAVGAACSLALAADITIAAQSAYFLEAFVNIGLVPDVGATWILPRQIGRARATGMLLVGERVPADLAMEWGMIWKSVPDAALSDEAGRIARKLAGGATRSYAMIRQSVRRAMEGTLTATLQEERLNQKEASASGDFAEGVAAYLGKRAPRFLGK